MHFAFPDLLLDHNSPHFYMLLVDYIFFFFATLHTMWDLSSPTKDQIHAVCSGNRVLTTEMPGNSHGSHF